VTSEGQEGGHATFGGESGEWGDRSTVRVEKRQMTWAGTILERDEIMGDVETKVVGHKGTGRGGGVELRTETRG
jgi:hypothetical protein